MTGSVFAKWALCTGLFMFHTPEGEKEAPCEKVGLLSGWKWRQFGSWTLNYSYVMDRCRRCTYWGSFSVNFSH